MAKGKRTIRHIINLDLDPHLKLWERLILAFQKLERIEGPMGWVLYKYFWDRLYIYKRELKPALPPPPPTRKNTLVVQWDQLASRPWMN